VSLGATVQRRPPLDEGARGGRDLNLASREDISSGGAVARSFTWERAVAPPFPCDVCGRVPPSSRGHPPSRQALWAAGRRTAIGVTGALAAVASTIPTVGRRRRIPECGPDRRREHQTDQHAHDDCAKRNIQCAPSSHPEIWRAVMSESRECVRPRSPAGTRD